MSKGKRGRGERQEKTPAAARRPVANAHGLLPHLHLRSSAFICGSLSLLVRAEGGEGEGGEEELGAVGGAGEVETVHRQEAGRLASVGRGAEGEEEGCQFVEGAFYLEGDAWLPLSGTGGGLDVQDVYPAVESAREDAVGDEELAVKARQERLVGGRPDLALGVEDGREAGGIRTACAEGGEADVERAAEVGIGGGAEVRVGEGVEAFEDGSGAEGQGLAEFGRAGGESGLIVCEGALDETSRLPVGSEVAVEQGLEFPALSLHGRLGVAEHSVDECLRASDQSEGNAQAGEEDLSVP